MLWAGGKGHDDIGDHGGIWSSATMEAPTRVVAYGVSILGHLDGVLLYAEQRHRLRPGTSHACPIHPVVQRLGHLLQL